MEITSEKEFGELITRVINRENIGRPVARKAMEQVLQNRQSDMHQGAFLAALRAKGETPGETAGIWEAIYQLDTAKAHLVVSKPLVDNCGTGMDAVETFNISTAASLVAAAAGVPMARHGARAITSLCGTVDLLEELGIDVECEIELVNRSIEKIGIGIYNGMNSQIHPCSLGRILSQISFGTILNLAASLANPSMPAYAVRGVHSLKMLHTTALTMREIGYTKALVVHGLTEDGKNGIDEASTLGKTHITELQESGCLRSFSFNPEEVGLSRAGKEDLAPHRSRKIEATEMLKLLQGKEKGPREDVVSLNSSLLLYLVGKTKNVREGIKLSREIIRAGKPMEKLKEWVEHQNRTPEMGLKKLQELTHQT